MADNLLVVVFLRGGCDGLNLVGPTADLIYQSERTAECRVARDGDTQGLALPNHFSDSDFRLHYKAMALKKLYDEKHLAIIHAAGLTNGTRSHFEAQDYMERGTPDNKNTSTGWLARLIADQQLQGGVPVISANNSLPASLLACPQAMAVPAVARMQLQGAPRFKPAQLALLRQQYQGNAPLMQDGQRVLGALDVFSRKTVDAKGKAIAYTPEKGVSYPTDGYASELSGGLKTIAQIAKMDVGLRVATVDYGGWDTHVDQGGRFANLTDGLSRSIAAFWDDMKSYQDRLTLVVMSEFGRRLKSNESHGTDHGHGNMMMVLGGHVRGGNIYGSWPGLTNEKLDNQVDLAVTTDYRTVLCEVISHSFNNPRMGIIFPKFEQPAPLGFLQA